MYPGQGPARAFGLARPLHVRPTARSSTAATSGASTPSQIGLHRW